MELDKMAELAQAGQADPQLGEQTEDQDGDEADDFYGNR